MVFRLGYREKEEKMEKMEKMEEGGGGGEDIKTTLHSFPEYQASLQETEATLMAGSLPPTHGHYIALLACSSLQCPRLATSQATLFLREGGDPAWLSAPARLDTNLGRVGHINTLMVNTPWLISPHHIRGLTVGPDSWSLGQAVQALTILAHFHALCTLEKGREDNELLLSSSSSIPDKENNPPGPRISSPLNLQDFCWEEQGFSVMSQIDCSDVALLLDDKFRVSRKLMAGVGGREVWNYVQAISGVYTDDCNYSTMKETVQGGLKKFIDASCAGSQRHQNYQHHNQKLGTGITPNKKALVSILVMEARLQAELLYALRAVMKFIHK